MISIEKLSARKIETGEPGDFFLGYGLRSSPMLVGIGTGIHTQGTKVGIDLTHGSRIVHTAGAGLHRLRVEGAVIEVEPAVTSDFFNSGASPGDLVVADSGTFIQAVGRFGEELVVLRGSADSIFERGAVFGDWSVALYGPSGARLELYKHRRYNLDAISA